MIWVHTQHRNPAILPIIILVVIAPVEANKWKMIYMIIGNYITAKIKLLK